MLEQSHNQVAAQRRRFARQQVWLRCWADDGSVRRYACVNELAAGGARLVTAQPPAVGSDIQLTLFAPGDAADEGVELRGRVVWRSSGRDGRNGMLGMQFDEETGAEHIMKYLHSR